MKFQSDGSKLEKIESFTSEGVNSGLYLDGVRVGDINKRLNLTHDNQDWLSLRPSGARYFIDKYFGEFDAKNNPHGRCIQFTTYGDINIGYYNNGDRFGNFIYIHREGDFDVGEWYLKDDGFHVRGTRYMPDGTSGKFSSWGII